MEITEKQKIAKDIKGLLGTGPLNWCGDWNYEFKKPQFSIFFSKKSKAEKALKELKRYGYAQIFKTPNFINYYFKYSVRIIL